MAGSSFGDDTSVSGTLAIIEENTAPSAPAAGAGGILYTKTDGKIYWISDDLSETDLTSGGGVSGNTFATDLKIGRDAHNLIDFSTDNVVTFQVNNSNEVKLVENILSPYANDGCALGSTSLG